MVQPVPTLLPCYSATLRIVSLSCVKLKFYLFTSQIYYHVKEN